MEPFNFNELPEVVRRLFEKVEQMESLIHNLQPKNEKDNDLMDITEAAEFLKVSVASLYTKVSRKEIPVSKPGKRLYFSRAELRDWIISGKKKLQIPTGSETVMYGRQTVKPIHHKLDKY